MNLETVHYFNILLGLGAILLQAFSVFLICLFFFDKKNKLVLFVQNNFLIIGFVLSFAASLASLIYSEIIGFLPCHLCWFQRIFTYPLVFIFGGALYKKQKDISVFIIPMMLIGLLISLYQNFVYYFGDSQNIPCDASGVSCYQQLVSEFGGYISIPMLALTSFVSILVVSFIASKKNK